MKLTSEKPLFRWLAMVLAWAVIGFFLYTHAAKTMEYFDQVGKSGLRGQPDSGTPLQQIWPSFAMDAKTWTRYALTVSETDQYRLKYVDIDNALDGRSVYWNSAWAGIMAKVGQIRAKLYDEPLPIATERSARWQTVPTFFLFIVIFSAWVARRAGAGAGVFVAFAMVGTPSFYEGFLPAYPDHHGLSTVATFGVVLGAIFMGGGWWRPHSAETPGLLPDSPKSARRAAVFSAIFAVFGMWITAAPALPPIALVGVFAVLTSILHTHSLRHGGASFDPMVWRIWGRVGGIGAFIAYLVAYFPNNMDFLRMEVNHPFYALAFLGAGECIAEFLQRWFGPAENRFKSPLRIIVPACFLLPALLMFLLGGQDVMSFREPFLAELHTKIAEFQHVWEHGRLKNPYILSTLLMFSILPALAGIGVIFYSSLPGVLARIAKSKNKTTDALGDRFISRLALITFAAFGVITLVLFLSASAYTEWNMGNFKSAWPYIDMALIAGIIAIALTCWRPRDIYEIASKDNILITFTLCTVAIIVFMGMWQMRWILNASGPQIILYLLLFATLFTASKQWTRWFVILATIFILFVPRSYTNIDRLQQQIDQHMMDKGDAAQCLYRDVARAVRATQPEGDIIMLASPNASTEVGYYGRFKTIGTLYWENNIGLQTAARMYSSENDTEALALLKKHGVTHIVIISEENFLLPYYQLLHPSAEIDDFKRSLGCRLFFANNYPIWVRPIPYVAPPELQPLQFVVKIFQVVPNQTLPEAFYHLGVFQKEMGQGNDASGSFDQAIKLAPNAIEPWLRKAEIALSANQSDAAKNFFEEGVKRTPEADRPILFNSIGMTFFQAKDYIAATDYYKKSLALKFNSQAAANLAWLLSTNKNPFLRDSKLALDVARRAAQSDPDYPIALLAYAAALADNNRFAEAVQTAQKARDIFAAAGHPLMVERANAFIKIFEQNQPIRE